MRVEVGDEAKKWCALVPRSALHHLMSIQCSALGCSASQHEEHPLLYFSACVKGSERLPLAGQRTA